MLRIDEATISGSDDNRSVSEEGGGGRGRETEYR